MQEIKIAYDPFNRITKLWIAGVTPNSAGSLGKTIIGKPMEQWLSPSVNSYKQWSGFLPEIVNYLNDDELKIEFCGWEEDYLLFSSALLTQKRHLERLGYDPCLYQVTFQSAFCPEMINHRLICFVEEYICFANTQECSWNLQYARKCLKSECGCTYDTLCEVNELLKSTITQYLASCTDEKFRKKWENAGHALSRIFA